MKLLILLRILSKMFQREEGSYAAMLRAAMLHS